MLTHMFPRPVTRLGAWERNWFFFSFLLQSPGAQSLILMYSVAYSSPQRLYIIFSSWRAPWLVFCCAFNIRAMQGGRGARTCSISATSRLPRRKRRSRERRRSCSISRVMFEGFLELLNALFVTVANLLCCGLA